MCTYDCIICSNCLERTKRIYKLFLLIRIVPKRDRVRFKTDWLKKFPARFKICTN